MGPGEYVRLGVVGSAPSGVCVTALTCLPCYAARRVTPSQLAALSSVLHVPVPELQDLLLSQPELAMSDAKQLADSIAQAARELGISPYGARRVAQREARLLSRATAGTLAGAAAKLAALLGVPEREVCRAAAKAPSLLRRDSRVLAAHLQRTLAVLGGLSMSDLLRLVKRAPQYLTASPTKVQQRLEQASHIMHRPKHLVIRALLMQPDLLFMSPRILRNKLKASLSYPAADRLWIACALGRGVTGGGLRHFVSQGEAGTLARCVHAGAAEHPG